jgi:putative acetyltransferase
VAEVKRFYVAEAARGRGAGRLLLADVLHRLPGHGYHRACLETACFMANAIALYHALGFQICPPFRPALDHLNLFMDRAL